MAKMVTDLLRIWFIGVGKKLPTSRCHWVWIVLLLLISAPAEAAQAEKRIGVVFRYDDPSARTNTDIEIRLIEIFRQRHMCCTFAVIPFVVASDSHSPAPQSYLPLPSFKIEVFRRAASEGVLQIAQHGYSHQTNGIPKEGYSEFVGLGYEKQLEKIEQGRQFLESELGFPIAVFVPPWNTYDADTIRAVSQASLQCISGDLARPTAASASLRFVPATCGIADLRRAVLAARRVRDPSPLVVALFHGYDFREVNTVHGTTTLEGFVGTLEWLSQQEDVRVLSLEAVDDVGCGRYLANRWMTRMRGLVPARISGGWYRQLYLSEEGVRNLKSTCWFLVLAFYGSVLLAAGVLSCLPATLVFVRVPAFVVRLLLLPGPLLLIGGLVWLLHRDRLGWHALMAIVGVLGYCVGTCAASLLCHCRRRAWSTHNDLKTESRK